MATLKAADPGDKTCQVVAVEKIEPPHGIEGGNWYRYEILLEDQTLVGNRSGTLEEVTQYANEFAETLGDRLTHGTSPWSIRKKK
jgi:hypothetical protein